LFFWQTSEEAEEQVDKGKVREISDPSRPAVSKREVKNMRADIAVGMAFSQLIMWSIIVTTSGSLHASGVTDVASAEEAAKALEPLVKTFPHAGEMSKTLFALGFVGTGLLAIPVLAGACGYALADVFGWRQGLSKKFGQAKYFYMVIAAATGVGLWINFTSIDPIQALIYTAVINGMVAVPILFAIMKISNDRRILGNRTNKPLSNILGWTAFAIMAASAVIMVGTWISGI
jgi:Mn2+/Fe2+ NRAMP family transporter